MVEYLSIVDFIVVPILVIAIFLVAKSTQLKNIEANPSYKYYLWALFMKLIGGVAVCLPDVRGTGETSPGGARDRQTEATSLSATELMLGGTLLGARLRDLRAVLAYLRTRADVDFARVALWGDSFAPVNSVAVLVEASRREAATMPVVLADAGVENINAHVGDLITTGVLRRVLASLN